MFKKIAICACLLNLAACASIIEGSSRKISLDVEPDVQATCSLKNERGEWGRTVAPSTTVVKRSKSDLIVNCDSPTHQGQLVESSSLEPWTIANILLGGIIGAGVDAATGAMFTYDDHLVVPMVQKQNEESSMDAPYTPISTPMAAPFGAPANDEAIRQPINEPHAAEQVVPQAIGTPMEEPQAYQSPRGIHKSMMLPPPQF